MCPFKKAHNYRRWGNSLKTKTMPVFFKFVTLEEKTLENSGSKVHHETRKIYFERPPNQVYDLKESIHNL